MRRRRHPPVETVHSISALPTSARDDQAVRVRSYLISMGIRTLCFVAAGAVAFLTAWTWLACIFLVGAVVLPYPAVVLANAKDNAKSHFVEPVTPVREIGTAEDQHHGPGPGESW